MVVIEPRKNKTIKVRTPWKNHKDRCALIITSADGKRMQCNKQGNTGWTHPNTGEVLMLCAYHYLYISNRQRNHVDFGKFAIVDKWKWITKRGP